MVSQAMFWDPLYADVLLLQLNEQRLANPAPFCDLTLITTDNAKFHAHKSILAACRTYFHQLLSSPPTTPPCGPSSSTTPRTDRVVELPYPQSRVLSDLLDYIYTSCGVGETKHLTEVGHSLGVPFVAGLVTEQSSQMKSKKVKGNRMEDDSDRADGGKTTNISLRFPLCAELPDPTAQNRCSTLSPHSPSSHERGHREAPWKMDATMDKKLPRLPKESNTPSATCSSSPIDLTAAVGKDYKSPPVFPTAGPDPQFQRPSLRPSPGPTVGNSGPAVGGGLLNGTNPEHSTTETAHILFNLSTRAYQGHGSRDLERRMDHSPKGNHENGDSPHGELGFLQPINPPPPPPPPPLLHSAASLTPPPPPDTFLSPPQDIPKPELLCGVCHRLFSTASSLTVHMRLHRGGRALSCRHCGKAFIHNKRLQSHEATCRQSLPVLPIQPKEEPLDKAEEELGDNPAEGAPSQMDQALGPCRRVKKGRGFLGRHRVSFTQTDGLSEDDHFIKVVDGHIIYFCTVCERSYMTLSSLKRHSNVHSWRRKYPCHFCDKVFALAEYRTKHEVWHTGERRYQCIFCWEAFPTYYNLKTHQKAFHGISPSLISSEKTANGGYKQKVNALKLYRLLPMRSQKRPYKTYSHSLADGLLLTPDTGIPLPLSMDCSLPTPLAPSNQQSLIGDTHHDLKEDPDGFPVNICLDEEGISKLAAAQKAMAVGASVEGNTSELGQPGNIRGQKNLLGDCGKATSVSSVITYGHPKPSVIVHGTAMSSSVIVHSNQIFSGGTKSPLNSSSPLPNNEPLAKASQLPPKKHSQKERFDTHEEVDDSEQTKTHKARQTDAVKHHKARKVHNKSCSSGKSSTEPATSEAKGPGPLCQITVRIGEEAIVKRSISETDLMRDKSMPPCKAKKNDTSDEDQRQSRHPHHHHRHKHRSHRSASQENTSGELQKNTAKSPVKVRKYFFRQEVREEESDQDTEDNLWRPYYSYKPKRKAPHIQKAKGWQRKMHYKRSLRLLRRVDRTVNYTDKEAEEEEDEEDKEDVKKEEEQSTTVKDKKTITNTAHIASQVEKQNKNHLVVKEEQSPTTFFSADPKPFMDTSMPSKDKSERQWPMGQAAECGTCGRWFSSSKKRDKHELTHLLEFVCMLCQASFTSQSKLEEHQKFHHPKTNSLHPPASFPSTNGDDAMGMEEGEDTVRSIREMGCPARVGRRPLVRHTCPHCGKVCKTATALGRHLKRHESGDSTDTQETQPTMPSASPKTNGQTLSREPETNSGNLQPTTVINYTSLATQSVQQHPVSSKCDQSTSQNQSNEMKAKSPIIWQCGEPETVTFEREASPQGTRPLPENVPKLTTNRHNILSSPSTVLVLNGAECLDYRTTKKKNLDVLDQRKSVPIDRPADRPSATCSIKSSKSQVKTDNASAMSMSTEPVRGIHLIQDGPSDKTKQGKKESCALYSNAQEAQDLMVPILSQSPCNIQAQDLTMPTILARERERAQQSANPQAEHPRDMQGVLLVPKEEPMSPVPSPKCSVVQTTTTCTPQKLSKSPQCSPNAVDLHTTAHQELAHSRRVSRSTDRHGLMLQASSAGGIERPSAHALLLPRASEPKHEETPISTPMDPQREGTGYPVQDLPLPLITPGGFRSGKKQDDNLLMSYPSGHLPFGSLGKVVPHGDLAKLPFYPDPYHLLYSPQLLAYPYNLAALPMALNMMAPGDKAESLPFLPALFNYAAAAAPYMGTAPHTLVANPALYSSSSSSGKKRDSANP